MNHVFLNSGCIAAAVISVSLLTAIPVEAQAPDPIDG